MRETAIRWVTPILLTLATSLLGLIYADTRSLRSAFEDFRADSRERIAVVETKVTLLQNGKHQ